MLRAALALPALAAASLHWLNAPPWTSAALVALSLLCLALLSRERWALWLWAWTLSEILSQVPLASGPVPFLYLALVTRRGLVPRLPFYRLLTLLGAVIALHAVVSFLAFRWAGGSHGWRPDITQPWLQALVWPYYCGHYPRGAHAVGLFLNDNLLGIWCVAVLALTLEVPDKGLAVPLILAVGWSYSRSAYLALLGASLSQNKRVLMAALLIPLLFLPFATGLDKWRFGSDWLNTLGGRAERLQQAATLLASGSLLGQGPSGLVDSQWLKTALELGWLGLVIQLGFCISVVRSAQAQPGLQAALIALVLGAVGCDLWHSPHLAATFLLLAGYSRLPSDHPARK